MAADIPGSRFHNRPERKQNVKREMAWCELYCAGMVISGRRSGLPVSASVKKNITAVSARFVRQSPSSIQNQWSR